MIASPEVSTRSLQAQAEALPAMRRWLEKQLHEHGLAEELRTRLVLAINEACMNIIQHAYGGAGEGEIRLRLELQPECLCMELEDDAPSIDPATVQPRPLTDIRPGGLGVHFIREIMDEMEFLPASGEGNRLRLVKRLDC